MRLLVTGGCGFIGSTFIHAQVHDRQGLGHGPERYPIRGDRQDLEILNLDLMTYAADPKNLDGIPSLASVENKRVDIADVDAVGAAFKAFEPDAVVHFAAESHVDRSIASGMEFVKTNVLGTQVLLDAARRHDVEGFVHVGTDEVYGSKDEGSSIETDPLDPSSPYSASKAGADVLALAHQRTYGLPVSVSRCTNNYGPRQHPEKLLPTVITKALGGEKIPIYGDGLNVRDWLYVWDHCTAIDHIMDIQEWGAIHHIGGNDERQNIDVVEQILGQLGQSDDLIEYVADRPGHDRRYSLDDSKLRTTGWAPRTRFDEGLKDTIEWYVGGRE